MTEIAVTEEPLEVFFSYAHEDDDLRRQLVEHLSTLQRQGVIADWHDRRIQAGQRWGDEIDEHLGSARIILLLISPSFMASDYCYEQEMTRALEREASGEARVVPVILRPVDLEGTRFSKLQALPRDATPITSWENRDEAFLDVARGIRRLAAELRESPKPATGPRAAGRAEGVEPAASRRARGAGSLLSRVPRSWVLSLAAVAALLVALGLWKTMDSPPPEVAAGDDRPAAEDGQQMEDLTTSLGTSVTRDGPTASAAGSRQQLWPVGSTIAVGFQGGTAEQRSAVERYARTWTNYANIDLSFEDQENASVLVAFDSSGGNWSFVGTDVLRRADDEPTMNLAQVTEANVLHQFGHVLGLQHEHGNPKASFEWNLPEIQRELGGPPNHWSLDQIRANVLKQWEPDLYPVEKPFDPYSVMLYTFPANWTRGSIRLQMGERLSEGDKEFVRLLYPGRTDSASG